MLQIECVCKDAGLENGFEKNLGFFKFLVKFYTNHNKFHLLIMICEYCYILQKML